MAVFTLQNEQHWMCPNCSFTDVTYEAQPHTRFHSCRGLRGLTSPMVVDGTNCKIEAVERDDFVKQERVQRDGEGRPIMAIRTTRDDGIDCAVLAPIAVGEWG